MRKTFVLALVALSVSLVLASCDIIPIPGGEKPADGLVTLGVNVNEIGGNSRSLTLGNAQTQWNFMEVYMKNVPENTWTLKTSDTNTMKITIRTGNYQPNDTLILLGRDIGTANILLAVGKIPANLTVDSTTPSITFNVTALKANLSVVGTKSFDITNTFTTEFPGFDVAAGIWNGGSTPNCFQVPENKSDIVASLTIDGLSSNGADILVTGATTVVIEGTAGTSGNLVTTDKLPTTGNMSTGEISFKFSSGSAGKYLISFNVPVIGKNAALNGTAWSIQGGINIGYPDLVGTELGDSIALIVVDPDAPTPPETKQVDVVIGGEVAP